MLLRAKLAKGGNRSGRLSLTADWGKPNTGGWAKQAKQWRGGIAANILPDLCPAMLKQALLPFGEKRIAGASTG